MSRYKSVSTISALVVREIQCVFSGGMGLELASVPSGNEGSNGINLDPAVLARSPRSEGK